MVVRREKRPHSTTGTLLLVGLGIAVAALYFWWAHKYINRFVLPHPGGYIGMLADAFLSGQMHLKLEPRPEMAQLADPYDPQQYGPYHVIDLSYFKGRYYLYFGAVPAVFPMVPFTLITGKFLGDSFVAALFMSAAYLLQLFFLRQLKVGHFGNAPGWAWALAAVILAIGNLSLLHLQPPFYAQLVQACAWFWFMVMIVALHEGTVRRAHGKRWLALASIAAGLMVCSRPNFLAALLLPALAVGGAWLRAMRIAGWKGPESLRVLLAAAVPIGLIAIIQMSYNHARFDSAFEFGMRYQQFGWDLREQKFIALEFFEKNAIQHLFSAPELNPYFPFLLHQSEPLGALVLLPFSWMALLAVPVALKVRKESAAGALLLGGIGAATVGMFLLLSCYYLAWVRHQVDYVLPLTLLGAVSFLGALHYLARRSVLRRLLSPVAGVLGLINVGMTLSFAIASFPGREQLKWLGEAVNQPIYTVERWTGRDYGIGELNVIFPEGKVGRTEPLLSIGAGMLDLLYVRYEASDKVIIGYCNEAGPVIESDPIAYTPTQPVEMRVSFGGWGMGPEHPAVAEWDWKSWARFRSRVSVSIDGRDVLVVDAKFHPATLRTLRVGAVDRGLMYADPKFTGEMVFRRVERPRPSESLVRHIEDGKARFRVRLNPRVGVSEPLFVSGIRGAADILSVRYINDRTIELFVDQWGRGLVTGAPITDIDMAADHILEIEAGALRASGPGETAGSRGLRVWWNGERVLESETESSTSGVEAVFIGANVVEASSAVPNFSGTIVPLQR